MATAYASFVAAAIDAAAHRAIDDVHRRRVRISRHIAATEHVANVPTAGLGGLFDIHFDGAVDGAAGVVATKDIAHHTTVDVEGNVGFIPLP